MGVRDPSDGTVKEIVEDGLRVAGELGRLEVDQGRERAGLEPLPPASGLPFGSTKPENLARLEKSREWLKSYRAAQRGEE